MKQQVDITLKLSLWLDATMDEDEIVTHVRSSLPKAFGEELTAMTNPVDIIDVRQEAEIDGTEETQADNRQSGYLPLIVTQVDDHYVVVDGHGCFYAKTYSSVDANLIAAGPKLLDALKDTLNMLRAAHMQCGVAHDSNKRVIKARAIVAEATGRAA
jgi:hypothetical protein